MLWGPPGIGKTSLVREVAGEIGLQVMTLRLVYLEPSDLVGVPYPHDGETVWLRPRFLPHDGEGVFILDDLPQALPAVQNAVSELVLDSRLGVHEIPKGWRRYVATGNDLMHRASTYEMPTHLANRMVHLPVEVDVEDWKGWAVASGVAPEVIGFLSFRPSLLLQFDPKARERAFPSPRSWEMTSKIVQQFKGADESLLRELVQGAVGEGAAAEFVGYLKVARQLPKPEELLDGKASWPSEPSAVYAAIASVVDYFSRHKDVKVAEKIIKVSQSLPSEEWGVWLMRDALRVPDAKGIILSAPGWKSWAAKYGKYVL